MTYSLPPGYFRGLPEGTRVCRTAFQTCFRVNTKRIKRMLRVVKFRKYAIQDFKKQDSEVRSMQSRRLLSTSTLTRIAEANGIVLDAEEVGLISLPNTILAKKVCLMNIKCAHISGLHLLVFVCLIAREQVVCQCLCLSARELVVC